MKLEIRFQVNWFVLHVFILKGYQVNRSLGSFI